MSKLNKKINIFFLLLSFLLIIFGLNYKIIKNDNNKPMITVTTTFLGDLSKNLLKDHVQINVLMGPGINPHNYQATPQDLNLIYQSKAVIYQGINLEGKLSEVLDENNNPDLNIIKASNNINEKDLIVVYENDGKKTYDPHIWFDINLWENVMYYLSSEYIKLFPEFKEDILQNTKDYQYKLNQLKVDVNKIINTLPLEKRKLITAHDAFNYFGRYNNFIVKGIQGINLNSETGTKDVQNLIKYIIDNKVKAIFPEIGVNEKLIKTILTATKMENYQLKLGDKLYSDSLGDINTLEGTYIGMYLYNVNKIVNELK